MHRRCLTRKENGNQAGKGLDERDTPQKQEAIEEGTVDNRYRSSLNLFYPYKDRCLILAV